MYTNNIYDYFHIYVGYICWNKKSEEDVDATEITIEYIHLRSYSNLIPASRAHAVSSNVARTRMCMQGTHERQKLSITDNDAGSLHTTQFFIQACLFYTSSRIYIDLMLLHTNQLYTCLLLYQSVVWPCLAWKSMKNKDSCFFLSTYISTQIAQFASFHQLKAHFKILYSLIAPWVFIKYSLRAWRTLLMPSGIDLNLLEDALYLCEYTI